MTDRNVDIQRLSPDKLLARFGKVPLLPFLLVGFILHVVIVGGTSVPYVMSLVNPQPEPPPAPPAAAPAEKSETGAASGSSSGAATTPAASSSSGGPESATASSSGAAGTPANVKNPEYLKSLNETAPPPKEAISGKELDDRLKME